LKKLTGTFALVFIKFDLQNLPGTMKFGKCFDNKQKKSEELPANIVEKRM
jgi:hypothetical protein